MKFRRSLHWCSCQGAKFWNVESCVCLHSTVEELFISHRLLEVEVRFATIRTQSQRKTRNEMRSSMRLVVTSNMQTHVRLNFQNEMPFGLDLRQ